MLRLPGDLRGLIGRLGRGLHQHAGRLGEFAGGGGDAVHDSDDRLLEPVSQVVQFRAAPFRGPALLLFLRLAQSGHAPHSS